MPKIKNETMRKYLEVFSPLLLSLTSHGNVALAGSASLLAHGLNFSRKPADLDVVIFSPTKEQVAILSGLEFFRTDKKENEYPVERSNTIKFQKSGLTLNFLLEREKCVPDDLLHFEFEGHYYAVQSVNGVIDAKRSFRVKGEHRPKDVADFLMLKTENFNL